ncbi:MAG: UvrD-helicase domain-containing protein [Candidatus Berkelbacteria bacterium]|nr:UvrD-helicase domain-containing protein [Candidatus Berkelbacteria bacterium]
MDVLRSLNESQKEAVLKTEGPVLILAGAGSGKTRALTHRIAYLMYGKMVSPQNILAVTFTNKAAGEMSDRIGKLLTADSWKLPSRLPWLGTFHSICVKILRREIKLFGYSQNFTIYDSDDSLRAVKRAMKDLEIEEKKYNPKAIRSFISGAKGELVSAKAYQSFAFDHFQKIVSKVYLRYEEILKKADALDFDDLIMKTVEIFQKHPEILENYQNIFKYILVDEYQDTNHAQYIFLKLLAQKNRNIFAIGDDWQSIYSFRGAKFQNILDFKKDYPDAKVIYLEKNYRSTPPIIKAAQSVILNNEMRSDKNLTAEKVAGAPVIVLNSPTKKEEVEFILDEIESLVQGEKKELCDFVVLYRTNAQSRAFEESLISRGVPYRIIGGLKFYARKEIKDVLAYLMLLQNPNDFIALSRAVNSPSRGIGEKTLAKISIDLDKAKEEIPKYKEFSNMLDKIKDFASSNQRPDLIIDKVLKLTGYEEYLSDGSIESESRLENLKELKNAASAYNNLPTFLDSVALISDIDELQEKEKSLTLMTVHAAKGLEFPVVFISGLEEGLFPHSQSMEDQFELEEERRLFYVGMTRAMDRLYISHAKTRFLYGELQPCIPSRFLQELPENQIEVIEL